MTAEDVLLKYRDWLYPTLLEYLGPEEYPSQFAVSKIMSGEATKHWEMVKDYPLRRGKYLRPVLLVLVAGAMGVDIEKVKNLAVAMQLSEEWILIHDDIEDGSILRRGDKALHQKYGVNLALNAGDALHALMWKAFGQYGGSGEVFDEFCRIFSRTILGQSMEIMWMEQSQRDLRREVWESIADSKTAYYTVAGPLRLGAMAAGIGKADLNKLTDFGKLLGRAFQLVDDILDVTGDFGGRKQFANDIYEGKLTLLLIDLLANLSEVDLEKAKNIVWTERDKKSADEVLWVVNKMKEVGSIARAEKEAADYCQKALTMFDQELGFLSYEPFRSELRLVAEFLVRREY